MTYRTLDDVDLAGKRVLLRLDLNVPVKNGQVTDATRIERIAPTLQELFSKGATTIVLAHFDRPKGKVVPEMSLGALARPLVKATGRFVTFVPTSWSDDLAEQAVKEAGAGDLILLENTRFHPGEEKNDPALAQKMAGLADLYVNDAFSAAHRAHASTEGVAHYLPAFAGRAMQKELAALEAALTSPLRPVIALVGGAKISTKLELLGNLTGKVNALVIGGAMANTFLAACGKPVGASLCEHALLDMARDIMAVAQADGCDLMLPIDAVVASELKPGVATRVSALEDVKAGDMILDIGPKTVTLLKQRLAKAKTIVWNGPLGSFETAPFDEGTNAVAREAARLTGAGDLVSIAGGGDTVAALHHAEVAGDFTYVSTAGGAFLEWLEGKELPGVKILSSVVD